MTPSPQDPRLPFSEACERNKEPILAAIRPLLAGAKAVLEIGSGTGQHAVHFAASLPHLRWHASDRPPALPGLAARLHQAASPNLHGPLSLDVGQPDWPALDVDTIFSANSLQIMSPSEAALLFVGAQALLPVGGQLIIYGPFNRDGHFTSPGNVHLDAWIRRSHPAGGIKDLEAVLALAEGFALQANLTMPANNHLLHWLKPG